MLDTYSAGLLKDYLLHPNILLEKTVRIDGSYGVVLAGDVKRIRKCISRAAMENSKSLFEKVQQNTFVFKVIIRRPLLMYM